MFVFNEVKQYLHPIEVKQLSDTMVTYFWEIKVAKVGDKLYVCAEDKCSGSRLPWEISDQLDEEKAVFAFIDKCRLNSK